MLDNLIKIEFWTESEYKNFMNNLKKLQDEKYRDFLIKIVKTEKNIIGIRDPLLKKIAKTITKKDWKNFLPFIEHKYFEETMLHGYILGYANLKGNEYFQYLDEFFKYINNWAACDNCVSNFKFIKKDRDFFFPYIEELCFTSNLWKQRIGLIFLLKFYLSDKYIDKVIQIISNIKSNEYYVEMAQAWLISQIFIEYEEKAISIFEDNILSSSVCNKAIQKIKDSLKVSKEKKIFISKFKM